MNIFFLSASPRKSAKYHNDKHVVKMILEYAQIICTVNHNHGVIVPYKPTHQHHPCVIWCGESLSNYMYLLELLLHLNREYRFRYNKDCNHKSYDVVSCISIPDFLPVTNGLTPIPLAMPDDCKLDCVVSSYRLYYKKYKRQIARWTNRTTPPWYE